MKITSRVATDFFDTLILGGGPAGAICAIELARKGIRVGIVNHNIKRFPLTELVSGRARRTLEELLGGSLPKVMKCIEVHQTVSLWGTNSPVTWNALSNPWGAGISVDRIIFDETLLTLAEENGATIIFNATILKVERTSGVWEISILLDKEIILLHSHFIVLAIGRTNTISLERKQIVLSSNIALLTRLSTNLQEDQTLYLESSDKGWWYSLPDANQSRFVGFCTSLEEVKNRNLSLDTFFFERLSHTRLLKNLLSGAVNYMPVVGRLAATQRYDRVTDSGWLAIGDAAFASDPLSGMGIEFAINSAVLGAHAIVGGKAKLMMYENWVTEVSKQHVRTLALFTNSVNMEYNNNSLQEN